MGRKVTNAIGKLRRLKKKKMPNNLECTCPLQVIMGRGCVCGASQAEKALKAQKGPKTSNRRDCASLGYLPAEGEIVVVRRPAGSVVDHGGISLQVWHACGGKQFEVLLSIWDSDNHGIVLIDVSTVVGKPGDDCWFPLDGLELP